jgi:hypothetical protein
MHRVRRPIVIVLWLQLPYIILTSITRFLSPDAAAPRELQAHTSPIYSSLLDDIVLIPGQDTKLPQGLVPRRNNLVTGGPSGVTPSLLVLGDGGNGGNKSATNHVSTRKRKS